LRNEGKKVRIGKRRRYVHVERKSSQRATQGMERWGGQLGDAGVIKQIWEVHGVQNV